MRTALCTLEHGHAQCTAYWCFCGKSGQRAGMGPSSSTLLQLGSAVIRWVTEVVLLHTSSSCLWSRSDTWWYFNKRKHCRLLAALGYFPPSPHLSREDNSVSFTCSSYCLRNFLWETLTQTAPGILFNRKENKKGRLYEKKEQSSPAFEYWAFFLCVYQWRCTLRQMPHVCAWRATTAKIVLLSYFAQRDPAIPTILLFHQPLEDDTVHFVSLP